MCISKEEGGGRREEGWMEREGGRKVNLISRLKQTYLTASDETLPNLRLLPYLCYSTKCMIRQSLPED